MSAVAKVVLGRQYRVKASLRAESTVAGTAAEARLYESQFGSRLDAAAARLTAAGGPGAVTLYPEGYFCPGASGDVTFTLVIVRTSGSGVVTARSGNGTPIFTVEDIGDAPS